MASTNKTTHYELSQYVSSDKPTYLGDYNGDMQKIDTAINVAKTAADTAQADATAAGTAASTAQTTANTAVTNAATAQTTANSANTNIGTLANLNTTSKNNVVEAINEVNSKHNYNYNEQVIGTWVDGKTIYRKVIDFGSLPNATNKRVTNVLSDIDTLIKLSGTTSGGLPIPYVAVSNIQYDIDLSLGNDNTSISITTGADRSNQTAIVIVEYTKNN